MKYIINGSKLSLRRISHFIIMMFLLISSLISYGSIFELYNSEIDFDQFEKQLLESNSNIANKNFPYRTNLKIGILLFENRQYSKALFFFNKSLKQIKNKNCTNDYALLNAYLAATNLYLSSFDANITTLMNALVCSKELDNKMLEGEIRLLQSQSLAHIGKYTESFSALFAAREIFLGEESKKGLALFNLYLAKNLLDVNQPSAARLYLFEVSKLNEELKSNYLEIKINKLLGNYFTQLGNLPNANDHLTSALVNAKKYHFKLQYLEILLALAQLNIEYSDYTKGLSSVKQVISLNQNYAINFIDFETKIINAYAFLKSKKYVEVIKITDDIISANSSVNISHKIIQDAYEYRVRAFKGMMDCNKAFEAQEKFSQMKESSSGTAAFEYFEHLRKAADKASYDKLDLKLKATEEIEFKDQQISEIIKYSVLLALILFLIVIILLIIQVRIKNKSNLVLERKNKLINESNRSLRKLNIDIETARLDAEAASVAKSNFLAITSHEIRTPMNGIIGMASLLSDTPLTKDQKKYINAIQVSSENLLTILNDILDFSKIEAGKMNLESTFIDLNKLVDDIIIMFEKQAIDKNVKLLKEEIPKEIQYILGDFVRLRQVLINLVSNAIKFTQNGQILIAIKPINIQNEKIDNRRRIAKIQFLVSDNGIGISEDKLETIFESFEQEDNTTTRKFGGIGLGLSICKKLVELMKGEIWVESTKDVGSTFFFSLTSEVPDKREIEDVFKVEGDTISAKLNENIVDESLKILVAEDNPFNKMLVEKYLEKLGYSNPYFAINGLEVLNILKTTNIDIILMDIQMPEMDGIEATQKIIKLYGKDRPYIVALTADASETGRMNYLSQGMDDFLSKPFKPEDLEQIFENFNSFVRA